MERVVIIGTSCSGKSYLAKTLSQAMNVPHIELDALYWLPDWQERSKEQFRQQVAQAVAGDSWIIDGNYSSVRDLVWPRATRIIWLNYPFYLVLFRAIKRTLKRVFTRQRIFSGNVESFKRSFLSRDSIILWVIHSHRRNEIEYSKVLQDPEVTHAETYTLTSPKQARDFLAGLTAAPQG